jgi:hypothetical protein
MVSRVGDAREGQAYKEVVQDARGGPLVRVCPALDAGLLFLKDEDGARADVLELLDVGQAAAHAHDDVLLRGAEEDERVERVADVAAVDGHERLAVRGRGHGGRLSWAELGWVR